MEAEQPSPEAEHPNPVKGLRNRRVTFKFKWLLAAVGVFVATVGLSQYQVAQVNQKARDQITQDGQRTDYFQARADNNAAINAYNLCVRFTEISLQSRGQHQQGVVAWEHLRERVGPGGVQEEVDQIIADLQAGPMLSQDAPGYDACAKPSAAPTVPEFMLEQGFIPTPPPSTVPIPTTEP